MYLSQTSEYALRATAQLASLAPGEVARAEDLASAADIPVHYLAKILRKLVVAGLLTSQRGHGGGFRLARAPARIRFLHVLKAVGEVPHRDHCAFGKAGCDHRRPCRLHSTWGPLKKAVHEWASSMTLADTLETERA